MKRFPLPPALFYTSAGLMIVANRFNLLMINVQPVYQWVGWGLIVSGILVSSWGSYVFKQHKTNINTFNAPDVLVASGPFRFTRNPMYIGLITALSGTAVVTGSILSIGFLAAFSFITAVVYIPYEEKRMRYAFGEQYLEYSKKVRRWL